MPGSAILNNQIINSSSSVIQSRKRRMEWDSIEIPQQQQQKLSPTPTKPTNPTETPKEGDRKSTKSEKSQGKIMVFIKIYSFYFYRQFPSIITISLYKDCNNNINLEK